mmetsp:Transcript_30893/g.45183  ORF Transcript_30893/g.45183 Transcript_30893/m.45183 type:complete len:95 (-) Transcript_30893:135-419(-)
MQSGKGEPLVKPTKEQIESAEARDEIETRVVEVSQLGSTRSGPISDPPLVKKDEDYEPIFQFWCPIAVFCADVEEGLSRGAAETERIPTDCNKP